MSKKQMENILNSEITKGVLIILIGSFILWLINFFRNKYIEQKIIEFLKKSRAEGDYKFRTTHAISSDTNISEDKIRKLCSKSRKIKRNQKEKESWSLVSARP